MKIYDCVILGGGVAGMSSAIYAKRRGKDILIIEKYALGGQVNGLSRIENFPSQTLIDGLSLSQMFVKQIENLKIEVVSDDILSTDLKNDVKVLKGKNSTYKAKSVIIATGQNYVELGLNENDFIGKGVSYCAVCDAHFFKGKSVCVASKKGSGIKDALDILDVCKDVTLLDFDDLSQFAKVDKHKNLKIVSNARIEKVIGQDEVEGLKVNGKIIPTSALFVELGKKPKTDIFDVKKDSNGFIVTDENMKTSLNGVYAVGDVRSKNLRQIITACSDGAIAGQQI